MNNKTWIAVIVGAVLISVAGLGIQHITASSDNSQLTTKEIREIVQDKYPGEVEEIELERENGKLVYEAELKGPKGEYEVTLDAFTGDVVNLKEKSPQASQNDDVSKRTTDGTKEQENHNKTSGSDGKTSEYSEESPSPIRISIDQAAEIALREVPGTIKEMESDVITYEFEIETDSGEAGIEIDALTGEIITISWDD